MAYYGHDTTSLRDRDLNDLFAAWARRLQFEHKILALEVGKLLSAPSATMPRAARTRSGWQHPDRLLASMGVRI